MSINDVSMNKESTFLNFLKTKSRVIAAWLSIFLFFFLTFWSGWLVSLLHSLMLTACMIFASEIESRYIIRLLQNKKEYLFYLVNFVFVIFITFLTIYLETVFLIYSKEFNDKIPLVPFLVRLALYIATVTITAISVLQQKEKETQRVKNELEKEKLNIGFVLHSHKLKIYIRVYIFHFFLQRNLIYLAVHHNITHHIR